MTNINIENNRLYNVTITDIGENDNYISLILSHKPIHYNEYSNTTSNNQDYIIKSILSTREILPTDIIASPNICFLLSATTTNTQHPFTISIEQLTLLKRMLQTFSLQIPEDILANPYKQQYGNQLLKLILESDYFFYAKATLQGNNKQ